MITVIEPGTDHQRCSGSIQHIIFEVCTDLSVEIADPLFAVIGDSKVIPLIVFDIPGQWNLIGIPCPAEISAAIGFDVKVFLEIFYAIILVL